MSTKMLWKCAFGLFRDLLDFGDPLLVEGYRLTVPLALKDITICHVCGGGRILMNYWAKLYFNLWQY